MAELQSGLRTINVDDTIPCPECGHENHLIDTVVNGWDYERDAGKPNSNSSAAFSAGTILTKAAAKSSASAVNSSTGGPLRGRWTSAAPILSWAG